MYEVSSNLYLKIADALVAAIGSRDYFSGVIYHTEGDTECKLCVTLFIERARHADKESCFPPICDLIPVWWEFSTVAGSIELLNDFSFSELKAIVLN